MTIAVRSPLPDVVRMSPNSTMTFLHNDRNKLITRCYIPADEEFSVPTHYHLAHDEYFLVEKGQLTVYRDGVGLLVTPEMGEVFIGRGVRHSFHKRKGDPDLIFGERTDPNNDNSKEFFFRNLLALGRIHPLQGLVSAYQNDCYPGFPGRIHALDVGFINLMGGWVAPLFGYKLTVTKEEIEEWHRVKEAEAAD